MILTIDATTTDELRSKLKDMFGVFLFEENNPQADSPSMDVAKLPLNPERIKKPKETVEAHVGAKEVASEDVGDDAQKVESTPPKTAKEYKKRGRPTQVERQARRVAAHQAAGVPSPTKTPVHPTPQNGVDAASKAADESHSRTVVTEEVPRVAVDAFDSHTAANTPRPPGAPPRKVSKEDTAAALQAVNTKRGIPAAREALSRFGCQRLSELKASDYVPFIEVCKEIAAAPA